MTRQHNGRRARVQATRQAILDATRKILAAGNFRPSAKQIGAADGFSARSVHEHFPTLESLYIEAVDEPTAAAICRRLPLTDEQALARAVVLGRITT